MSRSHTDSGAFLWVTRSVAFSAKNGKLLALAASGFDVLLTADKGMEYQQNPDALPMSVLVVRAHSNRLEAMAQLVPEILAALQNMPPRSFAKVGANPSNMDSPHLRRD